MNYNKRNEEAGEDKITRQQRKAGSLFNLFNRRCRTVLPRRQNYCTSRSQNI